MSKTYTGEEDLSEEGAIEAGSAVAPKPYEAFYERSTLDDEFTEEDLGSPAFRKSLMDHLRRLTSDNKELKVYREEFHAKDKRVAVLEAEIAPVAELTVISNLTLALGGLVAGVGVSQIFGGVLGLGIVILLFGLVLMFAPIIARKYRK